MAGLPNQQQQERAGGGARAGAGTGAGMGGEGGEAAAAEGRRKAALRGALVAFYEKHNPAQLADALLDEIVAKYFGKEGQLAGKLQRRYGEAPRIPYLQQPPPQPTAASASTAAPAAASSAAASSLPSAATAAAAATGAAAVEADDDAASSSSSSHKLDMTSPHFDPLLALQSPHPIPLPCPDAAAAPPLDNLSRCRHLLPPDDPEYIPPAPIDPAAAAAARREAKAAAEAKARARAGPPLVEALADGLKAGPLALLHRCFTERRPVCVLLRRIDGVRGTLTGQLRAFDRHFNLVLGEATERFLIPSSSHDRGKRGPARSRKEEGKKRAEERKRGCRAGRRRKTQGRRVVVEEAVDAAAGEGGEEGVATAVSKPPVVRQRQLPQVLVRGDNVVMVWEARPGCVTRALPLPRSPPPPPLPSPKAGGAGKRSAPPPPSPASSVASGEGEKKRRRVEG